MREHFLQCPHCWETISILIDTSVATQSYVEDCEVCCNPLEVTVLCEGPELQSVDVRPLNQ